MKPNNTLTYLWLSKKTNLNTSSAEEELTGILKATAEPME